ncbi:MAG TPA: glycosyltransferase family 4 protein [Nevskiaceae bacterium]|nr:glycosyltransferase family 4 protein [Nevskiaceae bacterium]
MPESPKTILLFVEQPVVADAWQAVPVSSKLVVRGWAFAEESPTRVEVLVDGAAASIVATGIAREDVMAALGGREEALRTGFEAHLRSIDLAPGKHLVEVRATSDKGATKSATLFVEVAASTATPRKRRPSFRRGKNRALFIDAATPAPDQDAGSNVALAHMKLLQSLGFDVTFVPETLLPAGAHTEQLQRMRIETIEQPEHPSLEAFLEARGTEFAIAYVHRYTVGEIAIPLLRTYAPQAKVIFNNADLHYLRMQREAKVTRSRALAEAAKKVKARELAVIRSADCTLICNSYELAILRKAAPKAKLKYLPWVIDAAAKLPKDFSRREGILYLGGFGHRPNVDAVKHFVAEVMPLLRKLLPDVRLHVYGSKVTKEIEALGSTDVIIEGHAPNLDKIFQRHRLSIAPLRFGAGFKGKLAESLARGVPAVASSIAIEGTGLIAGKQVLVADKPREVAKAIARAYEDEKLWRRLSESGWRYVKKRYSATRGKELLRAALKAAG